MPGQPSWQSCQVFLTTSPSPSTCPAEFSPAQQGLLQYLGGAPGRSVLRAGVSAAGVRLPLVGEGEDAVLVLLSLALCNTHCSAGSHIALTQNRNSSALQRLRCASIHTVYCPHYYKTCRSTFLTEAEYLILQDLVSPVDSPHSLRQRLPAAQVPATPKGPPQVSPSDLAQTRQQPHSSLVYLPLGQQSGVCRDTSHIAVKYKARQNNFVIRVDAVVSRVAWQGWVPQKQERPAPRRAVTARRRSGASMAAAGAGLTKLSSRPLALYQHWPVRRPSNAVTHTVTHRHQYHGRPRQGGTSCGGRSGNTRKVRQGGERCCLDVCSTRTNKPWRVPGAGYYSTQRCSQTRPVASRCQ